jgi:hypothetical protein
MVHMATKCTICGTRNAVSRRVNDGIEGMCRDCYVYAGWENTHSDDGHDAIRDAQLEGVDVPTWATTGILDMMADCPVCNDLDTARHQNTVAKTHRSHANCSHPRSPKGRAACRKSGGPKM